MTWEKLSAKMKVVKEMKEKFKKNTSAKIKSVLKIK